MVTPLSLYEAEAFPELEDEFEMEWEADGEGEPEGDYESEEFFRNLSSMATRRGGSQALQQIAARCARAAMEGGRGPGRSSAFRGLPSSTILSGAGDEEYEWELDGEVDGESGLDGEVDGEYGYGSGYGELGQISPLALMEHLGHAAAETDSEEEAEAFIGALIPLAASLLPKLAPMVMRHAPQLIRSVGRIAQTLRGNPATRQLTRLLPTVVRRSVTNLARPPLRGPGGMIHRPAPARVVAQQAARVISNPQRAVQIYRRSRALDRRYHRGCVVINFRAGR